MTEPFPVGLLVKTSNDEDFHKIHGVIDLLVYLGHAQKVEVPVMNTADFIEQRIVDLKTHPAYDRVQCAMLEKSIERLRSNSSLDNAIQNAQCYASVDSKIHDVIVFHQSAFDYLMSKYDGAVTYTPNISDLRPLCEPISKLKEQSLKDVLSSTDSVAGTIQRS